MKLTQKEINDLNDDGAEIAFNPKPKPLPPKTQSQSAPKQAPDQNLECLKKIYESLEKLLVKNQQVTVQPPLVTVNPNKPIRKWEFVVTKRGDFEKIITATAIE